MVSYLNRISSRETFLVSGKGRSARKNCNVLLLYRVTAYSRDSRDFCGCNRRAERTAAALAFPSICGKMIVDLRKGLDAAGLFESYLRAKQSQNLPVALCGAHKGLSCCCTLGLFSAYSCPRGENAGRSSRAAVPHAARRMTPSFRARCPAVICPAFSVQLRHSSIQRGKVKVDGICAAQPAGI